VRLSKNLRRLAATLLVATAAAGALAQDKPIHMIQPSSPGNVVDLVARTIGPLMAKTIGQPVVVENLAGAGGVTGTDRVVRAPRDGSTIGFISNNHVINPSVIQNIPFDAVKDVSLVSVVATTPLVLVVHPSLQVADLRELLARAKAQPGALNYGSAGNGTVLHLAGVLLVSEAGVDIKHVPYKGFANMLNDLLGGHIQLAFAGISTVAAHVKSGKLRALGISSKARSPVLPDVPTLDEAGLPGYSFDPWMALIAPAGTPRPVLDRLQAATRTALATPEVQELFTSQGLQAVGSAADPSSAFLATELDKHTALVKRSGAKLD
jgi:tripartite-type tricarboxylate transporter receptor subunit TctC